MRERDRQRQTETDRQTNRQTAVERKQDPLLEAEYLFECLVPGISVLSIVICNCGEHLVCRWKTTADPDVMLDPPMLDTGLQNK